MWERLKSWRWGILTLLLIAAGITYAFWPEAAPVDTVEVSRGPMQVGVTDKGVTRTHDVFVVAAPVTGFMTRIELEPGDKVFQGMTVTTMTGRPSTPLDPRSLAEMRGALASAQAAERGAAASVEQLRRDLGRAEALAERGFYARSRLEALRAQVQSGDALVAQTRAEVARVRAMLAQPTGQTAGGLIAVRAPASGSVLTVKTESAGVIPEGTPLMEIGDPAKIEIVADMLSREAVQMKTGDRVEITQWGGKGVLTGSVKRIEPFGRLKVSALGIEEQRVNVIIGFDEASAERAAPLGHGYQVDATVVLWRSDSVLRVPVGALFRGGDGSWRVFLARGGRTEQRVIKLGHVNDEFGEVLEGLSEGDAVVLNPGSALQDRARIKARK